MTKILIDFGTCIILLAGVVIIGKFYHKFRFFKELNGEPGISLHGGDLPPELKKGFGKIVAKNPRSKRSRGNP